MKPVYRAILISLITNFILVLLKVITGIVTNTKTVIADGVHSLSDLSTDVVAFVGQKLSGKKADEKHPRGHGKIEYITSAIIGIVIIVFAILLIESSIKSPVIQMNNSVIIVVIITIIIKYILSRYIYKTGKKYNNSILLAGSKESMADVLSSVAVLLIVIVSNFSDSLPILKYSDKIGTFVISLFILKTGFVILKENLSLIIGECETDELILNKVKDIILDVEEVKEINSVILIKYGSYYDASVKIGVDKRLNIKKAHEISKTVKRKLLKSSLNIKYVTTHMNPYEKDN